MFRNLASSSYQPLNYETSMGLLDSCQTIFLSWPLQNSKTFFCAPQPSEHGSLVALKMALLCREAGFPPGLVGIHFENCSSLDYFSLLNSFSYLLCHNFFASEYFRLIVCLWNVYVSSFFSQIPFLEPIHRWPCYRAEQRQGSGFWKIIGSPWSLSLAAEVVLDPE